jgi:hypothetical protein
MQNIVAFKRIVYDMEINDISQQMKTMLSYITGSYYNAVLNCGNAEYTGSGRFL